MPSAVAAIGIPRNLEAALGEADARLVPMELRRELLSRSFELHSGRERPGRFWKIDIETLDYGELRVPASVPVQITAPAQSRVIACDLASALAGHREIVERACGTAVDPHSTKFAALAAALRNTGAFVYVPADLAVDEPIEIAYDASAGALFPYTLVVLEHGAQCTVIERLTGPADAFVCGITEVVTADNALVTYAVDQELPDGARVLFTRTAKPGKDARMNWAVAELGAHLSVTSVDVAVENQGVQADIAGLFFPRGEQHIDLISNVDHNVGNSRSETIVKSAATGRGQGRYVGNIRIVAHAQGTESWLHDDALLLSQKAHIDSVPALEIAANDVRAYHGATVGAIDEEQIFYMTSRGIDRESAEKMIALGFFEPAIDRFPTQALRERLRAALEEKVRA
ncbi:MAG TPA: Fe-S cluster assembly protein SufD [Candidatus Baltobacteraceae bacterium]|nr:Fe-S cluster assembly protein SufD [Candidatus Baltobacteraceae bacterium]